MAYLDAWSDYWRDWEDRESGYMHLLRHPIIREAIHCRTRYGGETARECGILGEALRSRGHGLEVRACICRMIDAINNTVKCIAEQRARQEAKS